MFSCLFRCGVVSRFCMLLCCVAFVGVVLRSVVIVVVGVFHVVYVVVCCLC